MIRYQSCPMIDCCALNFNGRIDTGRKCMTLCCENVEEIPGVAFENSASESVKSFIKMRAELVAESVKISLADEADYKRKISAGCAKCSNFMPAGSLDNIDGKIHYVNLSMYPAPCQCKCVYCDIHDSEDSCFNKKYHEQSYKKLFDILEYAKNEKIIAKNASWQIPSGEITIHPYRCRILDLVKNDAACFYTNAFIFDEKIAANLAANPNSAINLSIDSGTPETWHKVKGVNNFETVMMNLVKYYNSSSRPGQITLKYIILPGINDNLGDFKAVVEIMKVLKCKHLTLARDTRIKYSHDEEQSKKLIGAAGYLIAILAKNGLTFDMYTYTPAERKLVIAFAQELLQKKKV